MLNRTRYMLLVFTDTRSPEQRATEIGQAQEALDREIRQRQPATQGAEALRHTTPTMYQ
jgi:rod shape-determining protein MreC